MLPFFIHLKNCFLDQHIGNLSNTTSSPIEVTTNVRSKKMSDHCLSIVLLQECNNLLNVNTLNTLLKKQSWVVIVQCSFGSSQHFSTGRIYGNRHSNLRTLLFWHLLALLNWNICALLRGHLLYLEVRHGLEKHHEIHQSMTGQRKLK